ncbi:hypothetical protein A33Q_1956 [Indibacter alkaliphilus LW1]|uniref:Uncharacterized protein n=1 Tax=Indibacter alkaliphilus (strain CCUG 57479 / KCTC 22604 / LW1) TaxID=1189612 RepID=S2E496_INDAL|nr:hypothetical protein A33Q_1956 [Indibacter alkaliphilus LW1]
MVCGSELDFGEKVFISAFLIFGKISFQSDMRKNTHPKPKGLRVDEKKDQ